MAGGAPADHRHRGGGIHAVGHQRFCNFSDAIRSHHDDLGPGRGGDLGPIDVRRLFGRILMTSDERKLGTKLPVRQRHARIIRHSDKGRNSRHNLKRHAGVCQLLSFFSAPSKDVRVAAFEPHNGFACARLGNEQLVQFGLGNGGLFGSLAPVDNLGGWRGKPKQVLIDQRIINHHVRPPEQLRATQRQQTGIARPCPD